MRFPVAFLALWLLLPAVVARGADPTLDVIPAEVVTRTLPKDAPLELEVRLKAADGELTAIVASTFSNDGISAEFAPETPARLAKLAPNAEYAWRLKLTRSSGSVLTESTLHVRVGFDVAPAEESGPPLPTPAAPATVPPKTTAAPATAASKTAPAASKTARPAPGAAPTPAAGAPVTPPTHRLIYTSVKIKPQPIVTGIEIAKAEIKGAPDSLAHERPGRMFILVTNQYSRPLTVTAVHTLRPTYITVKDTDPDQPKLPIRILPGQAADIFYTIEANSAVVPGKYNLIATVDVTTDDNLAATVRTPAQEINVVVLGESDVLKFLGIPSLLFLPGVVMLAAWKFLWSFTHNDDAVAKYRLQWNTSDFWIIAIALSLATAAIYPILTPRVPPYSARDFVAAYGLVDFGLILCFSLIASTAVFGAWRALILICWGLAAAGRAIKALWIANTTPSTEDTPLQILGKLPKSQKGIQFEQFCFKDQPAQCLLSLPWSTKEELWLVPPIELGGINRTNYDALDESYMLTNGPPPVDAAVALARIQRGIEQRWWREPGWSTVGDVRHPIKVPREGWTKLDRLGRLIQGN
jgi:hypothetical protein